MTKSNSNRRSPIGSVGPILVDLENMTNVKCKNCEGTTFEQAMELKLLSPLVSPSGKEQLMVLQVLLCKKCGTKLELSAEEKAALEQTITSISMMQPGPSNLM